MNRPLEVYSQGSAVYRLLDHLKCMVPPPGLLVEDHLSQVLEPVLECQDVYVCSDGKVGFTETIKHEINMEDAAPVKLGYRHQSFFEKEHITAEVEKLHKKADKYDYGNTQNSLSYRLLFNILEY